MRRALTIPGFMLGALLLALLAPLWLPLALLVSVVPATRGMWRFGLFLTAYLWCESIGITVSLAIWLKHANPAPHSARWRAYLHDNYRLQCWWAHSLKRLTARIFDLTFVVENAAALEGPAAIVLPRHTSMGDTVVPIVWYSMPRNFRLRYVLKKQLLLDPCLDIVGNRLPNCFVDRDADDPAQVLSAVAALLRDIGDDEGVLIYPEGTRFTVAKRAQVLARFRERGDAEAVTRLERWPNLMPPRMGGTLALLSVNTRRDILFCAHTGFEGSARFNDLINGSWAHTTVRIRFWRVPFAAIPHTAINQQRFLFAQWDQMQTAVQELLSNDAHTRLR